MKIEMLRYFVKLEGKSSITEASRDLFISQQGLNKAISSMEDELGRKLIERGRRGIRFTNAGKRFLHYAKMTLESYDDGLKSIGVDALDGKAAFSSKIDLIATPYAIDTLLSEFKELPLASLREASFKDAVDEVISSKSGALALVDLFYEDTLNSALSNRGIGEDEFVFLPLISTKLGIVSMHGSQISKADFISIAEVAGMSLAVVQDETVDRIINLIFGERRPDVSIETTNSALLLKWLNEKHVPLLLDSFAFWIMDKAFDQRRLDFTPIETSFINTVGFLYRKNSFHADQYEKYCDSFNAQVKQIMPEYHRFMNQKFISTAI